MWLWLSNLRALSVNCMSVASADPVIEPVAFGTLKMFFFNCRYSLRPRSTRDGLVDYRKRTILCSHAFRLLIKLSSRIEISKAYLTVIKSYLRVINHCLLWRTVHNAEVILLTLLAPAKLRPLLIVHVEIQLHIMSALNWEIITHLTSHCNMTNP